MNLRLSLILIILSTSVFTSESFAQDTASAPQSAAEAAANLRTQLAEVQAREAALRARANELDEAMKPENIERALAGIGSTRPEELREQRRRELSIERTGVSRQLDLLATSHSRLELAIASADSRAYQQSAQGFSGMQVDAIRMYSFTPLWLMIGAAALVGILVIVGLIAFIRR